MKDYRELNTVRLLFKEFRALVARREAAYDGDDPKEVGSVLILPGLLDQAASAKLSAEDLHQFDRLKEDFSSKPGSPT